MSTQYKYIKIGLASPEEILSWSHGEVLKHETINYRTLKPEPDGLFCEKIFGPQKDYQCACGKSKRNTDKGKICEKCGVEITEAKVRRERLGHIQLASPVVHTWFLRNSTSPLATLLDIKTKDLEEIVYLASYIVISADKDTGLVKKQILTEAEYSVKSEQYPSKFKALTGAEAVKVLLKEIDLEKEEKLLRRKLKSSSKQRRDRVIKRLEVIESFLRSDNKPEWMILEVLPVIPPDLRPMVQLEGGRFATTDLNDLYRRILNRNNRLKKQFEQHAPHLITKNEKRMLQEAVDALIDNSKRGKKAVVEKNHHLKSLSDMLRGKQGRFRQNLLGKRVDYSGRSVIVVGPSLKMYQCGIPKEMALTLFKPFVLRELIKAGNSIAVASKACDNQDDSVWSILEEVIREHPVLLNRAPTLHRLGIQAFEPVLIEGKAIRLHPLVCTPFNADFDGDQMAVHVPLSLEAQAEARLLMLASNNILNPKDGKPVVTPSQDMILGNYYLTLERAGRPNEGHFYKDFNEAYMAYKNGNITLHTRIFVDPSYLPEEKFAKNVGHGKYLFTTLGKMIFNSILPDEFPYLNEPTEDNLCIATPNKYFLDPKKPENTYEALLAHDEVQPFKKKNIARIIAEVFKRFQITETSRMLDRIKDLGFKYSTIAGLTISAADVLDYQGKQTRIAAADKKIDEITLMYDLGQLTNKERKKLVEKEWGDARNEIQEGLWAELSKQKDNHIFMMADSGSRGNASNFAQLAGMRGLMANTAGETIEVPVKANFREGLTVSEFFISTHGSRKGSTDTALKTAESGYLTRRLVDVSQDVIISTVDCGTEKGVYVEDIIDDGGKIVVTVADRVIGRFAAKDLIHPETGELICRRNELFTEEMAALIAHAGIKKVAIRTNITCDAKSGVCMLCYGRNLATNKVVEVGEAVGTVAAQSIGEPGTQLTMRTFHTGGVASAEDITQGLPRVQELFEARKPKGKATISEIDGTVDAIEKTKNGLAITIKNDKEEKNYNVDATSELLVSVGSEIKRGEKLMKGSIHPKELLRIKDAEAVQKYIVEEVQKVYRSQSVEISDKHIEIIVRQMMRKLIVVQEGDTDLLPGRDISINEYREACAEVIAKGGVLPTAKPLLLGITKAALACQSFLSACSFQETTRILTHAAIQSKVDHLVGLKENVIIGGLIPAGTGVLVEDDFECEHRPEEENIYQEINDAISQTKEEDSFENEQLEDEDEILDDEAELDSDYLDELDASLDSEEVDD
ncbi:MAG: DNA-directed RNA polymerase subunit beta' [Roseburia sp.]|nr:DNA-directed RNA polymerase subunit beta' [Roseburia sp.]